jgi:RNA recognition motif-containing protein
MGKSKKVASDSESSLDDTPAPVVAKKWAPKQLFVSGLPYETTEDQLKAFFDNDENIG